MKYWLSAAIVTLAAVPASAQSVQDILGVWEMNINAMGQSFDVTMNLSIENGELAMTMQSPQGDQPAENVKYENNVLSWTTEFGPAKLDLEVDVDGATFTGEPETPFGNVKLKGRKLTEEELEAMGSKFEFLEGDWDTTSEYDGQMLSSKLRITINDGRIFGADMVGGGGPDAEGFVPMQLDGDTLRWRVALPYVSERGGLVQVKLDREEMTFEGTMRSSLGEIPITGKYVDTTKLVQEAYDNPEPVIGDWDLDFDLAGTVGEAIHLGRAHVAVEAVGAQAVAAHLVGAEDNEVAGVGHGSLPTGGGRRGG